MFAITSEGTMLRISSVSFVEFKVKSETGILLKSIPIVPFMITSPEETKAVEGPLPLQM